MHLKKIIFIVGPTAVGKSEAAYSLAQNMGGEIMSCDSMQIYREVNIASNKPSAEILRKIKHHLIDVVSVTEEFDVNQFNKLALAAVREIHQKNHIPLVVGGSGLYMQVLLDGIFEGTPRNEDLRKALEAEAEEKGNQVLYDRLADMDREAAGKIHLHDLKRIIRALEVCMGQQQPMSQLQKRRDGLWGKYDITLLCLNRSREELYQRIDRRVEDMFSEGLVDEIKSIYQMPLSQSAKSIIGIQEVGGYLNGEYDLARAKEMMKLNTRHFAKRQLTWFRKETRLQWVDLESDQSFDEILQKIMQGIH